MGANGPNHFGLEKWKKTMFSAAKQRSPVRAGSVSFLAGFGGAGTAWGTGAVSTWELALRVDVPMTAIQAVTSEPTFSPEMTRRIFPGWFMLKITIGRLLSLHRLTAVASITFSPSRRISM